MADEPETPSTAGLGGRALRGTAVTLLGQLLRMLVQIASVVILARLLTPEDYGLFGMVLVVAGLTEVFRDFGLSQAAIQAPRLSRAERDNLFWLNSAIGFALTLSVLALSWPTAWIFGRAELVPLICGVSVVFLINGISTQLRASLSRSLRFLALMVCDVVAAVLGLGVAVLMAWQGFGAWALIGQLITTAVVLLVLTAALAGWVPGRPQRGVPMGHFVRYGGNLVATQVIGYLGNNADSFIIGVRMGAAPLGIYNRAFQLLMVPVGQVRAPITNVAIPVLSRLQEENDRFWDYARRGQLALGYLPAVGLGLVIGAATPITAVFLGPTWMEAAPLLRLLAVAAVVQTLTMVGYWVFLARGITNALFRYNLFAVTLKVALVLIGSRWGIEGIAAGYALSSVISGPLSLWWLRRATTGMPLAVLAGGMARIGILTGVVATAAWGGTLLFESPVLQLISAVVCWGLAYALCGVTLPWFRRDLGDLFELVKRLRNKAA